MGWTASLASLWVTLYRGGGSVADSLDDRAAIQRDLSKPECWTYRNLLKFNKDKI